MSKGLLFFKHANKTLFEMAVECTINNVIMLNGSYRRSHINEICTVDDPKLIDSYASRVVGYCSVKDAYQLVDNSNALVAQKIKAYIVKLYEDGDYVVVNAPSTSPTNQTLIESVDDTYCIIN